MSPKSWLVTILFGGIGAVLAIATFAPVTLYRPAPSYDRDQIDKYLPFSPALRSQRKYVIVGSCDIALPIVANDPDNPERRPRFDSGAWLGNMMNYVAENEFGDRGSYAFYDMSKPSTVMPHHLLYLYNALNVPGLAAIIYVGGLSTSQGGLNPEEALALVSVLERLAEDYPGAAEDANAYRAFVLKSDAYKAGRKKYGPHWRARIDPETLAFLPENTLIRKSPNDPAFYQDIATQAKRLLGWLLGGPAEMATRMLDATGHFAPDLRRYRVNTSLDWAKHAVARVGAPRIQRNTAQTEFLLDENRDLNRIFYRLIARVAEARHVDLVIYAQPMLAFSEKHYRQFFVPNFIDVVKRWLADFPNVKIIDQTLDHDLVAGDFAFDRQHCPAGGCDGQTPTANGYWANELGRLKQSRLLLRKLIDLGLVPRPPVARSDSTHG